MTKNTSVFAISASPPPTAGNSFLQNFRRIKILFRKITQYLQQRRFVLWALALAAGQFLFWVEPSPGPGTWPEIISRSLRRDDGWSWWPLALTLGGLVFARRGGGVLVLAGLFLLGGKRAALFWQAEMEPRARAAGLLTQASPEDLPKDSPARVLENCPHPLWVSRRLVGGRGHILELLDCGPVNPGGRQRVSLPEHRRFYWRAPAGWEPETGHKMAGHPFRFRAPNKIDVTPLWERVKHNPNLWRIFSPLANDEFRWAGWLLRENGVVGRLRVEKPEIHFESLDGNSGDSVRLKLRRQWHDFFAKKMAAGSPGGGNPHGLALALVLGQSWWASPREKESFRQAALAHMMAASGFHVGLFLGGLGWLLGRGRAVRGWTFIVQFGLGLGFLWLIGFPVSANRAFTMFFVWRAFRWRDRRTPASNILAVAAALVLWVSPMDIFSVGFWLSFSAMLGILLFMPGLSIFFTELAGKWPGNLLALTFAANAFALPLVMLLFGEWNPWFPLVNLILMPVLTLVVALTFLTSLLLWPASLWPVLEIPAGFLATGLGVGLRWIYGLLENWSALPGFGLLADSQSITEDFLPLWLAGLGLMLLPLVREWFRRWRAATRAAGVAPADTLSFAMPRLVLLVLAVLWGLSGAPDLKKAQLRQRQLAWTPLPVGNTVRFWQVPANQQKRLTGGDWLARQNPNSNYTGQAISEIAYASDTPEVNRPFIFLRGRGARGAPEAGAVCREASLVVTTRPHYWREREKEKIPDVYPSLMKEIISFEEFISRSLRAQKLYINSSFITESDFRTDAGEICVIFYLPRAQRRIRLDKDPKNGGPVSGYPLFWVEFLKKHQPGTRAWLIFPNLRNQGGGSMALLARVP